MKQIFCCVIVSSVQLLSDMLQDTFEELIILANMFQMQN